MTTPFFGAGETVEHQTYETRGEDAFGNEIEGWTSRSVEGVGLDVQTAQEITGGSVVSTQIIGMTAFMPPVWTGKARDRIKARGLLYEIDGDPVAVRNAFTGETYGVMANLKRVTG